VRPALAEGFEMVFGVRSERHERFIVEPLEEGEAA
jgi:hypothetical protein